jgi:CubicO group peptidase (beta-lactamase class C family)
MQRRAFIASLGATALAALARVPARAAGGLDANAITAYLAAARSSAGEPALGAAISRKGEILYAGGVGLSNLATSAPEDANEVFLIASVSKTMAAVAVMQLVERGKVKLDDTIQTYAPWFPVKQKPITLRHLMTHTSGIHHYLEGWNQKPAFVHYATYEESTRFWRDDPLLFDPGSAWLYSSFAVSLLQAVVETAGGLPFEDYLKQNVWSPAGMTSTQFDVAGRTVSPRDQGYVGRLGSFRPAPNEDDSYKYASGGILSTDADLCRFGSALNEGKLLSRASLGAMYALQLPPDIKDFKNPRNAPGRTQALIWFRGTDRRGRTYFEHSGSGKGTITEFVNLPDDDIVVSLHRNSSAGDFGDVVWHLVDLVS